MKRPIFAILFVLAFVISCDQTQTTTATEDHSAHAGHSEANHDAVVSEEDHSDSTAQLELDNGKKWTTNPEMLPYITEQKQLIDGYNSDNGDYKKLASDLNSANEKLIKSCKMKGQPHDVLHVWLTDHMKNIDLLGKATDQKDAENIVNRLEDSMETYNKYFG